MACETATTAAAAGCATAVALTLKEGGKALAQSIGSASLKRLAGSNAATAVAFGLVEIGWEAASLAQGKISSAEFARKATATTGAAACGFGGAAAGAAVGTMIFPGVGTAIGAFVGGLCGSQGGRALFDAAGEYLLA